MSLNAKDLESGKKKPVLVFVMGMHRSGTSLVTNIIHSAGYFISDEADLMPATDYNKKGYFERISVMEANEKILDIASGSWDNPPSHTDITSIRIDPLIKKILLPYYDTDKSVLKDPRFSLTFPVWEHLLDFDLKFIFVHRNSAGIAASLMKRDAFTESKCHQLIDDYVERTDLVLKDKNIFHLNYDELFSDKRDEILTQLGEYIHSDKDLTKIAENIIDDTLRHFEINGKEKKPEYDVKVSIIIPVFNKVELTKNCIDSIYDNTTIDDYEIIVVNNNSIDSTADYLLDLSRKKRNIKIITNDKNVGFAAANNQAVKEAVGEYIVLLNNDTVVKKNWLNSLVKIVDSDLSVGGVGAKLLYPDGKIQHAGVVYVKNEKTGNKIEPWHIHYGKEEIPDVNIPMQYQALTAACMLIRKSLYNDVNGFDEIYWNGYEDIDLCMKIAEKGAKLIYQPECVVIHHESQSGGERFSKEDANKTILQNKWRDTFQPDFILRSNGSIETNVSGKISPYVLKKENKNKRPGHHSIIIVTYNSGETIKKCLLSVFKTMEIGDEIVLVDNASTDNTIQVVKQLIQGRNNCKLIENNENKGFSEASNMGVRSSLGKNIVFLNPDTIVSSHWLSRMAYHLNKSPEVGAVGPVSNYAAGLQNLDKYIKGKFKKNQNIDEVATSIYKWQKQKSVETKLLTGFCLMISYDILEKMTFLDPELFLGNDDLDLSWRLSLHKYKLMVASDVFIYHEGQHSFKKAGVTLTSQLVQESTDILYKKLQNYYGENKVPHPLNLWGIDWFRPSEATFISNENKINKSVNNLGQSAEIMEKVDIVSIIMLTFNALEWTKKAVRSILEHTRSPYEIIFVDNASSDGTKSYLKKLTRKYDHISYIKNSRNMGFAKGNNQGVQKAKGKHVLLLNNDVLVSDGWLDRMLTLLRKDEKIGIVGPLSNYISGRQMIADVPYKSDEDYYKYATDLAKQYAGKSSPRRRLAGFAMLMPTKLYRQLDGFDETFGSGNFEDDDLCLRTSQAGYALMVDESTIIHHFGSKSFEENKIPYNLSLEEKGRLFKNKWPGADLNYLLEKDETLVQKHEALVDSGAEALIANNFEVAEAGFHNILKENPINADALYGLALSAKLQNNNVLAMEKLRHLLLLWPDYADAYNQSGIIAFENEDYDSAQLFFINAVEKDPDNIEAQKNLADIFLVLENYDEAVRLLHLLNERYPEDPSVLIRMLEIYRDSGRKEDAAEYLKKLEKTDIDIDILEELRSSLI